MTVNPKLQSYEKDQVKINFVINQISRNLDNNLRVQASADTTIKVNATTGNDSTGGILSPFKTWQGALNYVANSIDGGGFSLTILGDGTTYTTGMVFSSSPLGWSSITIDGANGTINTTSADCFRVRCPIPNITLQNFTLTTTTSGSCIDMVAGSAGIVFLGSGMVFGSSARSHIALGSPPAIVWPTANISVTGGARAFVSIYEGGFFNGGETNLNVDFGGLPLNFSQYTVYCESGTVDLAAIAFTNAGSVIGQRFLAFNGTIKTDTGGSGSIIPGNLDGFVIDGFYC